MAPSCGERTSRTIASLSMDECTKATNSLSIALFDAGISATADWRKKGDGVLIGHGRIPRGKFFVSRSDERGAKAGQPWEAPGVTVKK